jgi:drug/metabolite transporter (DMT)-like permease
VRLDTSSGRAPSRPVVWLALVFLTTVWALNFIAGKNRSSLSPRDDPRRHPRRSRRHLHAPAQSALPAPPGLSQPIDERIHESRVTAHDLWTFLYLGFLGVTVKEVCFTIGLRFTSVTHSAIIVGMGPIYALILAVLFCLESAALRKVIGMTISLLGVILLATARVSRQHSPTLLGDFITFVGSLGFAFYAVLGKRVAGHYNALSMTTYNFLFGALFVLPIAIHRAIAIGPHWLALPWPAWAALLYMALFSSSLGYLFYFWLLRYLEVT